MHLAALLLIKWQKIWYARKVLVAGSHAAVGRLLRRLIFAQCRFIIGYGHCFYAYVRYVRLTCQTAATYGIVPFVNTKNVGLVSGIKKKKKKKKKVGAGGNVGGMMFGFLFKSETITYVEAFTYIGYIVIVISVIILITRFQKQTAADVQLDSKMAGSAA